MNVGQLIKAVLQTRQLKQMFTWRMNQSDKSLCLGRREKPRAIRVNLIDSVISPRGPGEAELLKKTNEANIYTRGRHTNKQYVAFNRSPHAQTSD